MEWIKCSERLPEISQNRKLFVNGKGEVTFGYVFDIDSQGTVWIVDLDRESNEVAKYWMPLPESPKEGMLETKNVYAIKIADLSDQFIKDP